MSVLSASRSVRRTDPTSVIDRLKPARLGRTMQRRAKPMVSEKRPVEQRRSETRRGLPYANLDDAPLDIRSRFQELPAKLNLFRMLANSEGTFLPMMSLISSVFGKLELEPRLREIAILFTGRATRANYMWRQHLQIAEQAGVTVRQTEAIALGRIGDAFDNRESVVLQMADELLGAGEVSEATLDAALPMFSPAQIVEIILVVGFYRMLAGIMRSTDLDLDVQPSGSWTQQMPN